MRVEGVRVREVRVRVEEGVRVGVLRVEAVRAEAVQVGVVVGEGGRAGEGEGRKGPNSTA